MLMERPSRVTRSSVLSREGPSMTMASPSATGGFSDSPRLRPNFTIVTLSACFMGGEVVPLFVTGATLGSVLGPLVGLPPAFAAALGCVAVFGGATNTLLAPIAIGGEIFGFGHLPLIFVVCTTAYVCNGNSSIYSLQKGR